MPHHLIKIYALGKAMFLIQDVLVLMMMTMIAGMMISVKIPHVLQVVHKFPLIMIHSDR